jgi:hypothetical protein
MSLSREFPRSADHLGEALPNRWAAAYSPERKAPTMIAISSLRPRLRTLICSAVAIPLALAGSATAQPTGEYKAAAAPSAATVPADAKDVVVVTVHVDGNANVNGDGNHPAEPFPTQALPAGGGFLLTPPGTDGAWRARAFVFVPSQVVVFQGTPVRLHFADIQGPSYRIQIDGHSEIVELKRGEVKTVEIPADKPGVIGFRSLDRLPSMQGSVIVLPRP